MARYPGRNGVIYLATTGTGTASSVISLSQWTLNRTAERIDVTSFGDANKTYVQGLPDVQGTFTGFYDDTEGKPFTAATSSDGCKLYLYVSSSATSKYAYGPAWLDVSVDTAVAGAVTISGTFAANGSWGLNL